MIKEGEAGLYHAGDVNPGRAAFIHWWRKMSEGLPTLAPGCGGVARSPVCHAEAVAAQGR